MRGFPMKKVYLFMACLCACMVLCSLEAFAALVDMTPLSSFDQTGYFNVDSTGGYFTSANYAGTADGSWYFEGHAVEFTQTSGSPFVISCDITFGTGSLTFYNGGDMYTSAMSGSGSFSLAYMYDVVHDAWAFDPSASTLWMTGSGAINDASGNPTGFSVYTSSMQGLITSDYSTPGNPNFAGQITSLAGQITGSPVPVPAALWLFGSGLLGLAGMRKKIRG